MSTLDNQISAIKKEIADTERQLVEWCGIRHLWHNQRYSFLRKSSDDAER